MAKLELIEEARSALNTIQSFDVARLGRADDLGRQLSFDEGVPAARALVDIYKRVPEAALDDFSESQLQVIREQARSDMELFRQVMEFDVTMQDASGRRTNLLQSLQSRRDQLFQQMWQFIAYGVARDLDTVSLETRARSMLQGIREESERAAAELERSKVEASNALAEIRAVAAEQGVSQTAVYFKTEADAQEELASRWLKITLAAAVGVVLFAVGSMFLHKIQLIRPENQIELLQLVSSKILIFAVLGYLLLLAARNYSTHKHNAVVNRHRQNALLTYRTLVSASASAGTEDIVLAHAAACIFAPQETGFSGMRGEQAAASRSVLELLTKGATREA